MNAISKIIPIRRCYALDEGGSTYVIALTKDDRLLRHIFNDWEDAKHPHEIASVINIRGRIFEDYWTPFTPAPGASQEDSGATSAAEALTG